MPPTCQHLDQIHEVSPSQEAACTDCLATGDRWVHLRLCLSCGHVACCDSSPNQHASRHSAETGHAIAASFEPREDWAWCYVDEVALDVSPLHLPHRGAYPGEA